MRQFPDESTMPRSEDGTEPIRGGSVGLNRILSHFVDCSRVDHEPRWRGFMINAATVFRNIWSDTLKMEELEDLFTDDLNLFIEYLSTYLNIVSDRSDSRYPYPVYVYFPDYQRSVNPSLLKEQSGKNKLFWDTYNKFAARHAHMPQQAVASDEVICWWGKCMGSEYPAPAASRAFDEIVMRNKTGYRTTSPLMMVSHVPLDLHIASRKTNIVLMESYTGKQKSPRDFRFKLDPEGRLPFLSVIHATFGDKVLIKSMLTRSMRKVLFEAAVKDRWLTKTPEQIIRTISDRTLIPQPMLRSYNFS